MKMTAEQRAQTILAQMTLDEKLSQMCSYWIYDLQTGGELDESKLCEKLAHGIGQITRLAGGSTYHPVRAAQAGNQLQKFLVEGTRLGIPAILHEECCSGAMVLGGSMFPQMIGLASTFQPELAETMADAIRRQLLAIGARQGLAPVLDVARDPRWGRVEETFGEDPILISHFGMAYVKGLQGMSNGSMGQLSHLHKNAEGSSLLSPRERSGEGRNLNLRNGVIATGKHFIGHSLSHGGLNCGPAQIGMRDLYEVLLGPFQAAIRDAGLASIMNSYPELDGELVAASRRILTNLLREELGFDGLLVSDYEAILMIHTYHNLAASKQEAAALALNAGIDVELPTTSCYDEALRAALDAGEVNLELVDQAVVRHLQKKVELGLFENPYVDEGCVLEQFETAEVRALARQIARQSMVLLKNDGLLPLKKSIGTVAVIGPNADHGRNQLSDYSYAASLEYQVTVAAEGSSFAGLDPAGMAPHDVRVVSVLDGVETIVSPETKVLYAPGCDNLDPDRSGIEAAAATAAEADAVILVLGDRSGLTPSCTMGETRDTDDVGLPGVQEDLAQAVIATGKPVVVVLISGRPAAIPWLDAHANAILAAWLPGEEGGHAVAETLFGEVNPGGKLPITFPRSTGQIPVFYNHKPSGRKSNWYTNYVEESVQPLYPFGHGLSYTTFDYHDFAFDRDRAGQGETVAISLSVTNTGPAAGDEVVQLFVRDLYASLPRPVKELKGYRRLSLQPGETCRLTFHLNVDHLAFYNIDLELILEPGIVQVMLGSSSEDIRCRGEFEIVGEKKMVVKDRLFVCPVDVA
jgi:beta-glucosidase